MATVMPSYNEIDGVPAHKNRFLLEKVLRREWGFGGLVVPDYYAIEQMQTRHGVAVDRRTPPSRRWRPASTSSCPTSRPTASWWTW